MNSHCIGVNFNKIAHNLTFCRPLYGYCIGRKWPFLTFNKYIYKAIKINLKLENMKKITLLFMTMLVSTLFFAQTNLMDFESLANANDYEGFEGLGSASVVADPMNASNMVGLATTSTSGNPWQGTNVVTQGFYLDLTTDKTITIKVLCSEAFTLRVEAIAPQNGGPAGGVTATNADYTTPNSWQTLTFNIAAANDEYNQIAVFYNWDSGTNNWGNPIAERTVYIDDIMGTAGASKDSDPVPPTSANNPTVSDSDVVLSIFNDIPGFTNGYNAEGAFGLSSIINLDPEMDETLKINFVNAGWGQYNNSQPSVASAGYFVFDYYAPNVAPGPNGAGFWVMINSGSGEKQYRIGDGSTPSSADESLVYDTWTTVVIPFSHFTNQGFVPADGLLSWKFDADSDLNTKLVYFDNILFVTADALSNTDFALSDLKVFPNPSNTNWNIKTNNTIIDTIQVVDIHGREVLNRTPNSSEAIIDASYLSNGVYFARINKSKTIKLVKQ